MEVIFMLFGIGAVAGAGVVLIDRFYFGKGKWPVLGDNETNLLEIDEYDLL